ncbi:hypothetical protein [Undibacterium sp. Ji49W]|uniref:hypothetical protein n=1 Tax=Undibacterium sp. Ji49W TaxID=3413040 RepID=UPI003BF40629
MMNLIQVVRLFVDASLCGESSSPGSISFYSGMAPCFAPLAGTTLTQYRAFSRITRAYICAKANICRRRASKEQDGKEIHNKRGANGRLATVANKIVRQSKFLLDMNDYRCNHCLSITSVNVYADEIAQIVKREPK